MAKIGIITDIHVGDASGDYITPGVSSFVEPDIRHWATSQTWDNRWYSNGVERCKIAGTTFQSEGVDFVAELGDLVDSQTLTISNDDMGAGIAGLRAGVSSNGYTGDLYHVIGNHETAVYGISFPSDGSADDWDEYYLQSGFDSSKRNNTYQDDTSYGNSNGSADVSYSFDRGGIHFCVIGGEPDKTSTEPGTGTTNDTWFEDDLASTNLPIVILSHYPTWWDEAYDDANPNAKVGPLGNLNGPGFEYDTNKATFDAITDQYNVQAILSGHIHVSPLGGYPFHVISAGIPNFHLRGNLVTEGVEATAIETEAAYYIFDIKPNSYKRYGRWQASIEVTGFSQSGESIERDRFFI